MDAIVIRVPGEPVPWKAPRIVRRGAGWAGVTPVPTVKWEFGASTIARQVMKTRPPLTGPLSVSVVICLPVPQSWPPWKREAALDGRVRPTGRPDRTNIVKAAEDACNNIVWVDDAQIVEGACSKQYSDAPCVLIRVESVVALSSQTTKRQALDDIRLRRRDQR